MPVRKIPKSYRSVTGRFPSALNGRCIGCESRLEQEFYLKLEFDRNVCSYEEQPFKISGEIGDKKVSYTPDCLINYRYGRPDRFVEIKYQNELDKNDEDLEARLSLARIYAKENGLDFEIVTDIQIRDTALDNYRLLYRFAKPPKNLESQKELILKALDPTNAITIQDLMQKLSNDRLVQASFKNILWHLLYTGEIETDLNRTIDNITRLRIRHGEDNIS